MDKLNMKSLLSRGEERSDKLSKAVDLIKSKENNKNYEKGGWDPKKGRWFPHKSIEGEADTLAYGMKLDPKRYSKKDLKRFYSQGITDTEAEQMVRDHINGQINKINKAVESDILTELDSNQLAGLLSYVHNVGLNSKWKMTKNLKKALKNKGPKREKLMSQVAKEMDINTVNGKFNKNLEKRRKEERSLFLKKEEDGYDMYKDDQSTTPKALSDLLDKPSKPSLEQRPMQEDSQELYQLDLQDKLKKSMNLRDELNSLKNKDNTGEAPEEELEFYDPLPNYGKKDGGTKYDGGSELFSFLQEKGPKIPYRPESEMKPVVEEDPVDMKQLDSIKNDTDAITTPEEPEVVKEELDIKAPDMPKVGKVEELDATSELESPFAEDEKSEEKQQPLTMDSLEQKFKELMKADKEERKTAAWATAASTIASLIDRASKNPIGIKPINFQAGDSKAEMQNLLAMGRAKGLGAERPMTAYQKAMLAEQKATRNARDARSKAERESRERLAQLKLKEKSKGLDLTKGQEALDKAYAKEYSDYIAAGGSKVVESDINKLDQIAKEMEKGKDMFTGPIDTLVEYTGGFDTVRSALNPRLQDIKSRLEQIIQKDLRKTLGAQFTEKEGKQFLEKSFDPKLSYEQNAKRLADFINMVKSRADIAEKSAKYFEDKGTLKGFKGVEESGYPSEIETRIQRVMDRNPGRTREEIVKALKAAGKL